MKTENSNINLPLEQKEELVDQLLIYMKNDLEKSGSTIKASMYNFGLLFGNLPEGEDLSAFKQIVSITDAEFEIVIKYCKTHGYVKRYCSGRDFANIQFTDKGLARANSAEKARFYKPKEQTSPITFNGPIHASNLQIGNNNTQNIENIINNLIKEVEKTSASEEEKKESKSLINKFFKNPIISSIISGATSAGIKALLGGM